jgi:hypothetical protein
MKKSATKDKKSVVKPKKSASKPKKSASKAKKSVVRTKKSASKPKKSVTKAARGCTEQSTKKYQDRPSPPYPANECHNKRMTGNDGLLYVSQGNKNGVYKWIKVSDE